MRVATLATLPPESAGHPLRDIDWCKYFFGSQFFGETYFPTRVATHSEEDDHYVDGPSSMVKSIFAPTFRQSRLTSAVKYAGS